MLKHTGPDRRHGADAAAEDAVEHGTDFAVAFADATLEFQDWFLDGYRDLARIWR